MRPERHRRFGAALALSVGVLTLAACGTEPGRAFSSAGEPAPAAATSAAMPLPYAGAPKIANPLPASTMDRNPCTLLTQSQVDDLFGNSPQGRQKDTEIAHACLWSDPERGSEIGVQLVYAATDGLSQVYAKRPADAFFTELAPVRGYPLVAFGLTDERPNGYCDTVVGIADNLTIYVSAQLSRANVGKADPCLVARRVADAVMITVKGDR